MRFLQQNNDQAGNGLFLKHFTNLEMAKHTPPSLKIGSEHSNTIVLGIEDPEHRLYPHTAYILADGLVSASSIDFSRNP